MQTVTPFNLSDVLRSAHAYVDETAVVAKLLETRCGCGHVMIDVGAHHGTSASYFYNLGWTIHCYEPDANNRSKLIKRFTSANNVTIDPRAVSDKPAQGVSFFTSEESTGISGLSAFRPTHKKSAHVDVTTITDIVNDNKLERIDFLKIDVEGFDFSVLKGVPWDHLKPEVIECEFEDAKTIPLGHNWRDVANYLHDKGYTVYISEWHPIIRYGIRHDWRRIITLDEADIPDDAWGNLMAFKTDPGLTAIREAFSGLIKSPAKPTPSQGASNQNKTAATTERPFYAKLGESLLLRAPRMFSFLRFARRAMVGVWRRRKLAIPAFAILTLPLLVSLFPSFADYRAIIWGGMAFAAAIGAILTLAMWTYLRISALTTETAILRASLTIQKREATKQLQSYSRLRTTSEILTKEKKALDKRLTITKIEFDKRLATTQTEIDKVKLTVDGGLKHAQKTINIEISKTVATTRTEIDKRLAITKIELDKRLATTQTEIDKVKLTVDGGLKHAQKTINIEISKTVAAAKTADDSLKADFEQITSEITKTTKTKEIELRKNLDKHSGNVNRLRERIAAGEQQIGVMRYPNAPRCMVLFGHHKCGSRFFRAQIFSQIAEMTGAQIRKYEILERPFHYSRMDDLDLCNMNFDDLGGDRRDVVLFSNATKRSLDKINQSAKNWKGIRILRDPRQVLVSNYFHHRGEHPSDASNTNGWIWDVLAKDKPILRELSEEDGLLYELSSISKDIIEQQLLEPFDDERVITIKLEEFAEDPVAWLIKISQFLNVSDIAGIDLEMTSANKESGPWRQHFTSKLRDVFKERYGQAVIDMGYAKDMDW